MGNSPSASLKVALLSRPDPNSTTIAWESNKVSILAARNMGYTRHSKARKKFQGSLKLKDA